MGTLHGAEASEQRTCVMGFRLPASGFRLLTDLRPDPAEALADVRAPIGPVVLPGPLVIHDGHALLIGLPLEGAVLVHEAILGAAIREECRNRRSSLLRDEPFEAAAGIARPPGRGIATERWCDEGPDPSPPLFERGAVRCPLRISVERRGSHIERSEHPGVRRGRRKQFGILE